MARRAWGSGSLYRRTSDGRWIGRVRGRYVTGTNRDEVRTRMAELRSPSRGSTEHLGDFLGRWLAVASRRTRRRTVDGYATIVERHLLPAFGAMPLGRLTSLDVQEWVDEQAKRFAPRTVGHQLAVLRIALGYALRMGLVERNVTTGIDLPRVPHDPPTPLTIAQARTLIEASSGDRLHALYVLALTTGMRQGELLGLRWADITGDNLTVRRTLQRRAGQFYFDEPKTERSLRSLPLSATAREALRVHRIAQATERLAAGTEWVDSDLVFTTDYGSPLKASWVTREFQRRCAEADLPRVRFHDLRHTAASLILERSGGNLRLVMEMLGHSTITTTADIYAHLATEAKRRAADDMDAMLG